MRKYITMIGVLFVTAFLLIACGDDSEETTETTAASGNDTEEAGESTDLPEDVIKDGEADPVELENQMGLAMGDTGYLITQSENQPLAATLNAVTTTQDIGAETKEGDEFYFVADFTFKNVGNEHVEVEFPDAAFGSEESAILNDELGRGDRLGLGTWYLDDNEDIDSDNPRNAVGLDAGEEQTHKIAIAMKESADEYIIYFGLFTSGNRDYQNKAAWTIQPEEID